VPGGTGAGAGTLQILADGLGQQVAWLGAYAYWIKTEYAELTGYKTGNGVLSFMTQGNGLFSNTDKSVGFFIVPFTRIGDA